MAEAIEAVFQNEKIEQSYIVGHSMGGYVGLAYLEHYPYRIKKMILLNTYPFEDTDQKIALRNKIIRLLKNEKKELLLKQLFRELIPMQEEGNFHEIRESTLRMASEQSTKSLIATTNGIKFRPDRSFLLKDTKVPVKWMLSRSDEQLDTADIIKRARKISITEPEVIEGGHMSFLEDPYEIFRIAHNYLSN
jgi:pimeloyl-ACP methyl ester carboxylesterase